MQCSVTIGDTQLTIIPCEMYEPTVFLYVADSGSGVGITVKMLASTAWSAVAYFCSGADDENHPQYKDAYNAWKQVESECKAAGWIETVINGLRFVP